MQILQVQLHNFGSYSGTNDYDFSNTTDKNIILVQGENGAGKTTLLNAIKIAFYGTLILGNKSVTKTYNELIYEKLNQFAVNKAGEEFFISVSFRLPLFGSDHEYQITRKWIPSQKGLLEEEIIHKDGTRQQIVDAQKFMSMLHKYIPLSLFELFFFDGEKIEDFLFLNEDISEMLDSVYNVDLFLNLKSDLLTHMKDNSQEDPILALEAQKIDLDQSIQHYKQILEQLESGLHKDMIELNSLSELQKHLVKEFELIGSNDDANRNHLSKMRDNKQLEKYEIDHHVREHAQEILPFIIMKDEIEHLKTTITTEEMNNEFRIVEKYLNKPEFHTLLSDVAKLKAPTIKKLQSEINECFKTNTNDLLHNLGTLESVEALTTCDQIAKFDLNQFLSALDQSEKLSVYITDLNDAIKLTDKDEYRAAIQKHIENELKIAATNGTLLRNKELQLIKVEELHALTRKKEELEKNLIEARKNSSVDQLLPKVHTVIDRYVNEIRANKKIMIEKYAMEMFKKLIRKDDYVDRFELKKDSADILIYNKAGQVMTHRNLSAGEKQIFVLSLLYGMLMVSERKTPLVFDTLLGRLDLKHKGNIIKELFSNISDQIILLATDSEIDQLHLNMMEGKISKHYKIDYDPTAQKTIFIS